MNNVILNNLINNFSGIIFKIFLPKFVPKKTASVSGTSNLYSLK